MSTVNLPILIEMVVSLLDPRYSPIASSASELWLNHHSKGYIRLLKDVEVLRINNVSDTGYNISIFLIDFEHLSCGFSSRFTEHRHLQWNIINLFQMLPNSFNPIGQDKVSILINEFS
jgi:hypothetical protein